MKNRFISTGRYFGYPDCCIAEFLQRVIKHLNGEKLKPLGRKLSGTGYIPCESCNKKTKAELIAVIAKNRKHSKPFPQDKMS